MANSGTAPGKTNSSENQSVRIADMKLLVRRLFGFVRENHAQTKVLDCPIDVSALQKRFHFVPFGKGKPEVILSEDVFVELGHPLTESVTMVLMTFDSNLVHNGRTTVVGPDLDRLKKGQRVSFAQAIVLHVDAENIPDPFDLENTQYLINRLPGYMVRSVPGRLWVRVGKRQKKKGLNLHVVGSSLVAAYKAGFSGVKAAEVVFVTQDDENIRALEPLAKEAEILCGKHKKLVLGIDGSVECSDLNCDTCDQKPVCDNLRDVVVKRRKEIRKKRAK